MSVQAHLYSNISQEWNIFPDPHSTEIDLFLHFQNQRLKEAIQHHKRQTLSTLVGAVESRAAWSMRKTEHELSLAIAKNRELQECVRRAELEAEAWEAAARENESVISELNEMLERAQDEESGVKETEIGGDWNWNCRVCGMERACVVVLPCMHLCGCRECGAAIKICPVCGCPIQGCIQVFF